MTDYFIKNNIDEFERGGKRFIYFKISGLTDNYQFEKFASAAKKLIQKYPSKSVYVITSHIAFFDSKTKNICSDWIISSKPYIAAAALVDINGLTRMIAKSIYKHAGYPFAKPFHTKEEAIEWLLTQEEPFL